MFFRGLFLPWVRLAGLWLFWPAVVVVIWGQLTPHPPPAAENQWDKAQHFIAYFGMALLATLGWGRRGRQIWILLGLLAMGGSLEIVQGMVGRGAEWLTQAANTLGALLGMGVAMVYLAIPRSLVDDPPRD